MANNIKGQRPLTLNHELDTSSRQLGRMTMLLMIASIIGKVTGQLRDILAMNYFQHGIRSDAYTQGFLIPDFVYQLLVGGSIQAAIIPTLSAALARGEGRKGWRAVSIFVSNVMIIMLGINVLGIAAAPWYMKLVTQAETYDLAVRVTRVLFPQTFFMMLAALSIGILNAYNRFERTAFGPVVYNVLVVISLMLFGAATDASVVQVTAGVTVSALIYFVMQAWLGRRELSNFHFALDNHNKDFRLLVRLAIPTLISASIPQLNSIVLNAIIGGNEAFPEGTATSLRNAGSLWMLPWGVIAVSVANVMMPSLAAADAAGRYKEAGRLLTRSLKKSLFITLPFAVIFFVNRVDIVRAVFQWQVSSYNEDAVRLTGGILSFYCLTIITHTIVAIMNNAFYSIKMTKIPLYTSLVSLLLTTTLGYVFSYHTALGASGLSLGYAAASLLNAIALLYYYRLKNPKGRPRKILPFVVRAVPAALIQLTAAIIIRNLMDGSQFFSTGKLRQLLSLGIQSVLSMLIYMLAAIVMGLPEVRPYVNKLLPKPWRS